MTLEDEDFSTRPCCILAEETGESHYHCAQCDGITGMFGHYNPKTRSFSCTGKTVSIADDRPKG